MTDAVLAAYDGCEPPVHFEVDGDLEIVPDKDFGLVVYGNVADSSPNGPWYEKAPNSPRAGWYAARVEVADDG